MRKIFFAAATILAVATQATAQEAVLKGKIMNKQVDNAQYWDLVTPAPDTIPLNADGSFKFKLNLSKPKTAYLVVEKPKGGIKVFLEPGDKLECIMEPYDTVAFGQSVTQFRTKFKGDNAECNNFLNDFEYNFYTIQNKIIEKMMKEQMTYKQFQEQFRQGVDAVEAKLNGLENIYFRDSLKADYEKKYLLGQSWYGELAQQPDDDYKSYLTSFDLNSMENMNQAVMYAAYCSRFCTAENVSDVNVAYFNMLPTLFTNSKIVSSLADMKIENIVKEAPSNLKEIYSAYAKAKGNEAIPANIAELYNHYQSMTTGSAASDFDMYDMQGNKVMLSDLRGKAVYIDCWATWCGPCKAEIPHMAKLYEHYKDNPNITLVSVSMDTSEAAWRAMVKKDNPGWPQYIVKDAFKSKLCTAYDIDGIPRFMMFDKNGNVVSLNAPRPSSEEIISFIDNAIK